MAVSPWSAVIGRFALECSDCRMAVSAWSAENGRFARECSDWPFRPGVQ